MLLCHLSSGPTRITAGKVFVIDKYQSANIVIGIFPTAVDKEVTSVPVPLYHCFAVKQMLTKHVHSIFSIRKKYDFSFTAIFNRALALADRAVISILLFQEVLKQKL